MLTSATAVPPRLKALWQSAAENHGRSLGPPPEEGLFRNTTEAGGFLGGEVNGWLVAGEWLAGGE